MGTDVDKLMAETFNDSTSSTLRKAGLFIRDKSFPLPKHWTADELENLDFPQDLTLLTTNELGKQMGLWTSVIAYTQFQVAMADVENTAKFNKLEFERRKLYLTLLGGDRKGTEEYRKSILRTDDAIVKLHIESEAARAKFILVKALLDAYSKYFNAFSRELSRRGIIGGERPPREDYDGQVREDLSAGLEKGKNLFQNIEEAMGKNGDT